MKKLTIGLIGNPNSGKTTLFNQLTGARQRVGNWAGVTVERKEGQFTTTDNQDTLVDLPGTYSLTTISSQTSLDEQIACHYILSGYADLLINVVDASNPQAEMQMHVVYETLKELGVMGKKIITLFNKQDAPGACVLRDFKSDYTLKVSAKTGEGLADLNDLLEKLLAEEQIYVERLFPYQEAGKIQLIREYGQLISEEYTEEGIAVKARVPKEIYARVV